MGKQYLMELAEVCMEMERKKKTEVKLRPACKIMCVFWGIERTA